MGTKGKKEVKENNVLLNKNASVKRTKQESTLETSVIADQKVQIQELTAGLMDLVIKYDKIRRDFDQLKIVALQRHDALQQQGRGIVRLHKKLDRYKAEVESERATAKRNIAITARALNKIETGITPGDAIISGLRFKTKMDAEDFVKAIYNGGV